MVNGELFGNTARLGEDELAIPRVFLWVCPGLLVDPFHLLVLSSPNFLVFAEIEAAVFRYSEEPLSSLMKG